MSSAPLAPGYTESDAERWWPEAAKRPGRSPFARDRARVLHSAALRRLAFKTQVLGAGHSDFVRNRLTHSLEVAQVGRELATALGCDPDIVDAACLAHDLGHPPFGHTGESALDALAGPCGGFEGNAQTWRLVTRLEPKVVDPRWGHSAGLNLTRATLDAIAKYPWVRGGGPVAGKYSVYAEDAEVFHWMRAGRVGVERSLEAQVMDFADDVAYSVHDVEDAIVDGSVRVADLADPGHRRDVVARTCQWYLPGADPDEVLSVLDGLRSTDSWPHAFDGSRAHLAALKTSTSDWIGRFCVATETATRAAHGDGPLTRYRASLVVPRRTAMEIALMKGVAAHYVMSTDDHADQAAAQRRHVGALLEAFGAGAPGTLDPSLIGDWDAATTPAARLRVLVDQVSMLTDLSAGPVAP